HKNVGGFGFGDLIHVQSKALDLGLDQASEEAQAILIISLSISSRRELRALSSNEGEIHKFPFSSSQTVYTKPLELIHSDLWGPSPKLSSSSYRYYVHFIDAYNRYTWVFLLKIKSEALPFKTQVEKEFECFIKALQSDWGDTIFVTPTAVEQPTPAPLTPTNRHPMDPKWLAAMQTEIKALTQKKTWVKVHLPPGRKAIGCKWVYKEKQNSDESVTQYKARPEISYAVNKVSQFMQTPLEAHWKTIKKILRYLNGTLDYGLHMKPSTSLTLTSFCDADWASDPDDRRSTLGLCVYLGSNIVSWSSKKQRTVSRSSTEAESPSLAQTTTEDIWVQALLSEIGVKIPKPPTIWCDNQSTVLMAANSFSMQEQSISNWTSILSRKGSQQTTLCSTYISL
uniref:Reverse transcriptase Ty1/copia-type domain-containing protein n=1 Tax=Cannabis sativa TaxID=3483 RepID=A0A803QG52_CANSA